MAAGNKAKSRHKFGGRNNGPARQKYWNNATLREHKVKNLMLHNDMTRAEATTFWLSVRKMRAKVI